MKRFVLVLLLLSQANTSDVYDSNSNRIGTTRESGSSYEVFDKNGNRVGSGRVQPDGSVRVYDPKTWQPLYEIKDERRRDSDGGRRRR